MFNRIDASSEYPVAGSNVSELMCVELNISFISVFSPPLYTFHFVMFFATSLQDFQTFQEEKVRSP